MVTVSHLVKREVDDSPLLLEALVRGIVNYAALADTLHGSIEKELKKKVELSAIIMALRRYADVLEGRKKKVRLYAYQAELFLKTNLVDIAVVRSPSVFEELEKIYRIVDYEKGDTLNVIHGNFEVTIVVNRKYKVRVLKILEDEKVLNIEEDLVSVALTFNQDFFITPGIIAELSRHLAWHDINITEIISTYTELNYIIHKKDATKAYEIFSEIIEEK